MACWEEWTLELSVVASSPLYVSDYGATQYDHALLSYPVSFERLTPFFVYLFLFTFRKQSGLTSTLLTCLRGRVVFTRPIALTSK